ncbi:hypothetical protein l11_09340 [Neisseria weaveri LMG 5135]|nr:hypothetical protein l11_09340 [Neisseria weaveri LMG 5135]
MTFQDLHIKTASACILIGTPVKNSYKKLKILDFFGKSQMQSGQNTNAV